MKDIMIIGALFGCAFGAVVWFAPGQRSPSEGESARSETLTLDEAEVSPQLPPERPVVSSVLREQKRGELKPETAALGRGSMAVVSAQLGEQRRYLQEHMVEPLRAERPPLQLLSRAAPSFRGYSNHEITFSLDPMIRKSGLVTGIVQIVAPSDPRAHRYPLRLQWTTRKLSIVMGGVDREVSYWVRALRSARRVDAFPGELPEATSLPEDREVSGPKSIGLRQPARRESRSAS